MNFYVYSYKIKETELKELGNLITLLYSGSKVKIGKSKTSASKDSIVIKADDVLKDSKLETAIKIAEFTGIGIPDKVWMKL